MILIDINGASAVVRKNDLLTCGMIGVQAAFRFDETWDGFRKTAVFRAGEVTKDVTDIGDTVTIPVEVLQIPGVALEIGVYGSNADGSVAIPTVWAKTAPLREGADPSGDTTTDPSLPVWQQLQNQLHQQHTEIDTALQTQQKAVDAQLQAQDSRVEEQLQGQADMLAKTYVKNTDYHGQGKPGLMQIPGYGTGAYGLKVTNQETIPGGIIIAPATDADIDARENGYKPITPANLDYAVQSVLDKHPVPTAIVCSAGGETVAVADAADYPIQGLTLYGKTTQVTTTGKNILNPYARGTFLNNNGNEKEGIYLLIDTDGTYSYNITPPTNSNVYIGYTDSLQTNATHVVNALKGATTTGTVELRAGQYFLLWFDVPPAMLTSRQFCLSLGTDTTYEPYTRGHAAPCPAWPEDPVSIGSSGTIGVTVAGKNLLEITAETKSVNGGTVTVSADGGITLHGTFTANFDYTVGKLTTTGNFIWSVPTVTASEVNSCYFVSSNGDGTNLGLPAYGDKVFTNNTVGRIISFIVIAGTYNNVTIKPMVRLATVTDAAYKPYKAIQSLAVSTPNGLHGIPVTSGGNYTDESGQAWICDEIDLARGVYVQRVGEKVLNGTEAMSRTGTYEFFIPLGAAATSYTVCDAICSHFVYTTAAYGSQTTGFVVNNGNATFRHTALAEDSADAFRAFLAAQYDAGTPVTLYYALAAPVETALSDAQLTAFRALHTNRLSTTVINDAGAGMALSYVADTKTYIDNQFAALSAAILNN